MNLNIIKPVMAKGFDAGESLAIPESTTDLFSITSIGEFVGALLSLAYYVAGILFFASFVIGGFQWIISGGKKEKVDAAKGRIMSAVVGLSIVAISYAVILLVQDFLGIRVIEEIDLPVPY